MSKKNGREKKGGKKIKKEKEKKEARVRARWTEIDREQERLNLIYASDFAHDKVTFASRFSSYIHYIYIYIYIFR